MSITFKNEIGDLTIFFPFHWSLNLQISTIKAMQGLIYQHCIGISISISTMYD